MAKDLNHKLSAAAFKLTEQLPNNKPRMKEPRMKEIIDTLTDPSTRAHVLARVPGCPICEGVREALEKHDPVRLKLLDEIAQELAS